MAFSLKIVLDGGWKKVTSALSKAGVDMPETIHSIAYMEAEHLRTDIVKGIRNQAPGGKPFLPLSRLTLLARLMKRFRGKKILMVTSQLIAAIQVDPLGAGKMFVGVPKGIKRTERGQELWRIADIQEEGGLIIQRRTAKSLRFLMALMRKAGAGVRGRARAKRSGRFRSTWNPQQRKGASNKLAAGARGVLVIRIPPRPYIGPAFKQFVKGKGAMEKRVGTAMEKSLSGVKSRRVRKS